MKKHHLASFAAAMLASLTVSAETYTYNTPNSWRKAMSFIPTAEGALQIKDSAYLAARNSIQVDPEKSYKISLKIRLAPGSKPSQVYLVAGPADEEGRGIQMYHVTPVKKAMRFWQQTVLKTARSSWSNRKAAVTGPQSAPGG